MTPETIESLNYMMAAIVLAYCISFYAIFFENQEKVFIQKFERISPERGR